MTDPAPSTDEAPPPPLEVPDDFPPDPGEASVPMNMLRRYRELRDLQKASETEGATFKEEADALQTVLVEAFTDAGLQNVQLDGKTIYLHRSVYAQRCAGVELEDVKKALRAAGAGDLVTETINANTLSAYVRELTEDDDAPGLPAELTDILEPGERFTVRIKAAAARSRARQ